jgi:hypothetical protein
VRATARGVPPTTTHPPETPTLNLAHLWPLEDDGHVDVAQLVAVALHQAHRLPDKHVRRRALPPGVGVREELADVRAGERAEDRVSDRVQQRVAVAVGDAAAVVRDFDAAQDELVVAFLQAVQVEAVADAEGEGGGGGGGGDGAGAAAGRGWEEVWG